MNNWIYSIFESFDDKTAEMKKQVLWPILFFFIFVTPLYAYSLYSNGDVKFSKILLIGVSLAVIGTFLLTKFLKDQAHFYAATYLVTVFSLTLSIASVQEGEFTKYALWWLSASPLLAAFLLNAKHSLIWMNLSCILESIVFFIDFPNLMSEMVFETTSDNPMIFSGAIGLTFFIGVLSAISDGLRQKAEREKEEMHLHAERTSNLAALGEMAGGIAHEINNPLMIISGSALVINKMVKKETVEREKILKHLSTIETTVKRAANIIKGLKTLARDGNQDERQEFTIEELMEEVLSFVKGKLKHSGVDLRYNTQSPLVKKGLYGQKVQISQVFLNLIGNAYDAIEGEPVKWIEIALEKRGHLLRVNIIDCGNGVPIELQKKIFNPFFTTKDVGKGTGLGLSLCHSIMKKNDGKLFIDNSHPNTCFSIDIPLYESREQLALESETETETSKEKVA
jgi:signal transduction histidine kinase